MLVLAHKIWYLYRHMSLLKQVRILVAKDIALEWRSKQALSSIILYIASTVFVCYQAFESVDSLVWNALFWIILLFVAINATGRSFQQESQHRQLYYYSITSPKAIVLSKIIYNTVLLICLAIITYIIYSVIFKNPVGNPPVYFLSVLLGSISFSTVFTMVAGISAKTGNNNTIMAILAFPVVIPVLILLLKLSSNALKGLERAVSDKEIMTLVAINVITITVSLLLFPYIWRD